MSYGITAVISFIAGYYFKNKDNQRLINEIQKEKDALRSKMVEQEYEHAKYFAHKK